MNAQAAKPECDASSVHVPTSLCLFDRHDFPTVSTLSFTQIWSQSRAFLGNLLFLRLSICDFNMDLKSSHAAAGEKQFSSDDEKGLTPPAYGAGDHEVRPGETRELSRALKGRHMQMIAIGKMDPWKILID